MQLKRSYSRRLKVEIEFYEYYFIARHAYSLTDLAVKTSRPQYFKEIRMQTYKNLTSQNIPKIKH
jgi:hypothetical protein